MSEELKSCPVCNSQQKGFLEVSYNEARQIVINLDKDRTGHIVFSQEEAISLATVLIKKVFEAKYDSDEEG